MKYCLAVVLILSALSCQAAVYEHMDKNGNVVYSDMPLNKNAKMMTTTGGNTDTVSTPPVQTITAPATTSSTAATSPTATTAPTEEAATKKPYTVFTIIAPKDQETIQNQPVIPVDIKIEPELQKGDSIQLLLDGNAMSEPMSSTHFELPEVERGSHQLTAVLLDANKRILKKSNVVNIFVHRVTLNSPARQNQTQSSPTVFQRIIRIFGLNNA